MKSSNLQPRLSYPAKLSFRIKGHRRGEGREIMVQRGEGTRQRICMNDPKTWTTVWELTVGAGGGMGRGGQRGVIGTTVKEKQF